MDALVPSPPGLTETLLSDQLWAHTLVRQIEAALAVEPLPHLAGALPGGAPGGVSPTHLVPARLFEDKPDVPHPECDVYKSKDLHGDGNMVRSEWVWVHVWVSRVLETHHR